MSGSECSGRFVGLFDPHECAPGSKALAGNSLGYRGRAACKCEPEESGLTMVQLMKEDFKVSESLVVLMTMLMTGKLLQGSVTLFGGTKSLRWWISRRYECAHTGRVCARTAATNPFHHRARTI